MAEAINSEDSNSPEVVAERKKAWESYINLFDTKLLSDVTIVVKGKKGDCREFSAHKPVLAVRYEYFAKMFTNWKEGNQNQITIHDIEPEVFNIILEFIYKGQLSNWKEKLETHAVDLIKATNLFGIDGLRKKCEKYIIRAGKINVGTASEYFILADEHNAPQLKEAALKFISENLKEVEKTNGYIAFKRHRTSPAELVKMLSPSKRPKLSD